MIRKIDKWKRGGIILVVMLSEREQEIVLMNLIILMFTYFNLKKN